MALGTPRQGPLSPVDYALIVLFLLGLYLGVSWQITPRIPVPCVPSGVAGLALLWRRRNSIEAGHIVGLATVLAVYLTLTLTATDPSFFAKRTTGLLQLTYSIVISYGLFLTMVQGERRRIANIFLAFALVIVVGCVLESNTGLRGISDALRDRLYEGQGIYDDDLRDSMLYGRVRPKLFTSEPSYVTFAYTLFSWSWLLISTWAWRLKMMVYLGLIGLASAVMPGPTLMLMFLLAIPGLVLLREGNGRRSFGWMIGAAIGGVLLLAGAVVIGQALFAERLAQLSRGQDASFFFRFTGPMLVAFEMFRTYPLAGAGLTGEPFITQDVLKVYMNASGFEARWQTTKIAEVLTNYFWLHWIYLGLLGGMLAILAVSLWLKNLGVPSVAYCWVAWIIMGQALGAYVGPKAWSVLFLAAAASTLSVRKERQANREHLYSIPVFPRPRPEAVE